MCALCGPINGAGPLRISGSPYPSCRDRAPILDPRNLAASGSPRGNFSAAATGRDFPRGLPVAGGVRARRAAYGPPRYKPPANRRPLFRVAVSESTTLSESPYPSRRVRVAVSESPYSVSGSGGEWEEDGAAAEAPARPHAGQAGQKRGRRDL